MKMSRPKTRLWWAIAACLAWGPGTMVADTVRYVNEPDSSMVKVEGDSTLHGWSAKSDAFTIAVEADFPDPGNVTPGESWQARVEFLLPATTLTSGRRGLDREMHSSLRVDEHPDITFTLSRAEIGEVSEDVVTVLMKGDLTCAGVTQTKQFVVSLWREGDRRVRLSGHKEMKMTDFDITPPRAMLGAIRAADEIKVSFEFDLVRE